MYDVKVQAFRKSVCLNHEIVVRLLTKCLHIIYSYSGYSPMRIYTFNLYIRAFLNLRLMYFDQPLMDVLANFLCHRQRDFQPQHLANIA